ncbi:MAG TPA: hypothetical protein VFV65_05965 [Gemmatimonadales bacterium]|nr:hypothetical protein [Gemmatimonadales bacterium]
MDPLLLLMRLLHVLLGAFWAGTLVFAAVFLIPSVRDAGPDGSEVMAGLMRRGYMTVMPAVALLTILSGFWLYWHTMATAGPAWAGSMAARVYGVGAIAALVAFGIGMILIRPSGKIVMAGMAALPAAAEGPEREALMARMAAARARMGSGSRWVAFLLVIATTCMALARYL